MKKSIRSTVTLALLAATALPTLAASNNGQGVGKSNSGGVAIAVGPRHPAVASVLLGGGTVAPTVHKQSVDFGVIATALTRGDVQGAGSTGGVGGVSGTGGKAPHGAAR